MMIRPAGRRNRRWRSKMPPKGKAARYRSRTLRLEPLEERTLLDASLQGYWKFDGDGDDGIPGPSILSTDPEGLLNLRTDRLTVTFDREMDPATFTAADVELIGPDGQVLTTEVIPRGGNVYEIGFDPAGGRGAYTVSVGPQIADPSGALMDQDADGTTGEAEEDVFTCSFAGIDADTIFTTSTTITEGDTTYDGQDICIRAATVAIDGPHTFNSVQLVDGAVLTHSGCTSDETHKLDLTVTQQIMVDAGSRIDVTGRGYLRGRTTGNTTVGGATDYAGGSYGGLGSGATTNPVYGDYANPNDWGSGGATLPGGGLVRITSYTLTLEGEILADGVGWDHWDIGAGSGGGVFIAVTTLRGSGRIQANGGRTSTAILGNPMGAGAGGRIALYAADFSAFNVDAISACGGIGRHGTGGAGTVYVRDTDEPHGTLMLSGGGALTPLGSPGEDRFVLPDALIIRGANAGPHHDGVVFEFQADVTLEGGSLSGTSMVFQTGLWMSGGTLCGTYLVGPEMTLLNGGRLTALEPTDTTVYKLELWVAGQVFVDSTSRIDVSAKGYPGGRTPEEAPGANAGGSYGGLGGVPEAGGQPNPVYGDYKIPNEWGTGKSGSTPGGGLVWVTADTLTLEGRILAGGAGWAHGGASGGGIYVSANTLQGSGTMCANGGDGVWYGYGRGAGGGGGRIAVYAADYSGFNLDSITAPGGSASYGRWPGEPGTVYLVEGIPPAFLSSYAPKAAPSGTDHVDLTFTRPIDLASFEIHDLEIFGPSGRVIAEAMTLVQGTTYRIDLPLLVENGTYHFRLPSTVLDTRGYQLDQNANGIPGESDDFCAWDVVVDAVPPRVTRHTPDGDVTGTVDHVDVWLSEEIARATFKPSDVAISDPGGQPVTVDAVEEVGLNRFRISFAPQTAVGTYHVVIGPDVCDLSGNLLDQDRDGVFGEAGDDVYDAAFNLISVDLELSGVVVDPPQLWAGEAVAISWHGTNAAGAPLLGDWTDAVYLSADGQWDIDDVLLEKVAHTGGLAQDEVYSASAATYVPGALPGDYYLIVRADVYDQENEGNGEGNNMVALGPLPLDVRDLPSDGSPAGGTLSLTDRSDFYAVEFGAGESIVIALDGQSAGGTNELYASFERVPTRQSYDYKATSGGPDLELALPGVAGGTFYILVYAAQVGAASPYEITAEAAEIFLSDVTPRRHGNLNPGTFTLTGLGFDETTSLVLVGTDMREWLPTAVRVQSPTVMTADLDLPNWPADIYDVRVSKPSGATEELVDVLTVIEGGLPNLETRLIVPGRVGYHWPGTIWIEYANTGDASMPSPLLRLHGTDRAILTLDASLAGSELWTDTPPPGASDTVQMMAAGSGATPALLQPGDSGRIPVYYLGLEQPWNFSDRSVEFDLGFVTAGSTVPIDWTALKDEMRAESMPADAWDAVWANLTGQVGDTWGDYVAMLNENMAYLHTVGQEVSDVSSLWAFEIAQASALWPLASLAGAVDAYSPAPGMPLTFTRVYGQPIDARYHLGPLGRGWSHNWDVYAEELSDGDVVIHGPGGTQRHFAYDGQNLFQGSQTASYTASRGDYATLTVDNDAYRLAEKHGTVWQFGCDNLLEYVEDTNGNRIILGYTSGQLTSLTHSGGPQLLLDYDAQGRLRHLTDPLGADPTDDRVTTYEYDASGEHLLAVTAPGSHVTRYTYDTGNGIQREHALLSVEYPDGTLEHFDYDDHGRLTGTHLDGGAEALTYGYDSAGTVTVEDATGRESILDFGLGGQLVQVRDGEGNVIDLAYDHDYQLAGLTGGGGQQYRYSYDDQGNLTAVEDPVRQITGFTYDPAFNDLASVTDARGNGIRYGYDNSGNLLSITYEDTTSESFTYDAGGNVLTWTNRRGESVTYTYNAAGQLTSKDYPDTAGVVDYQYGYDDAGNLISARDSGGTTTMTYDPDTDWLTRIEYPSGRFFVFEYDDVGRRTRRTDQDAGVVNYIYDAVGRLDRMTDGADALVVDYDYDAAGRLSRKTLGNGVYSTYGYDAAGQLTHLVNYAPGDSALSQFDYTYDASGRRTSMTTLAGTFSYGYDALGQLTSVTHPDGHVVTYNYDAAGNRIEVTDDAAVTPYTTNEMNQYTDVGGASYTFDDDGNLVSKTEGDVTTTYTYDVENRLIGVSTPTDTWTYTYDALGDRTASAHNGVTTQYVIDPWGLGDVAAEYDAAGNLMARYDHGYGVVSRTDATANAAYYTFDGIGSTSEVTDPVGLVVNSYTYDPFGVCLGKSETLPNPFEFVGEYGVMNEANGLEFMRARYYDPELGRFVQQDPIGLAGGDTNLYRYVENNPPVFADPSGERALLSGSPAPTGSGSSIGGQIVDMLVKELILSGAMVNHGKKRPVVAKKPEEIERDRTPCTGPPCKEADSSDDTHNAQGDKDLDHDDEPYDLDDFWPPQLTTYAARFKPDAPDPPDEATESGGKGNTAVSHMDDPNDKIGPSGHGEAHFVHQDDLLAYKIRFENRAEATAPAHIIRITDTLDADLDLSTLELTEIGFAGRTIIVPEGLSEYATHVDLVVENDFLAEPAELRVQIDVGLDLDTRELTFEMIGLNPATGWLPEDIMLGILYPNDETGRGDGYVSYLVKPKPGLPSGTEIINKASIVFDWNDPIDTPRVLNTIDSGTPESSVSAFPPVTEETTFTVQWSGEDEAGGSGIAEYAVYVSKDGGPYEPLLENTTETSIAFTGEPGHTYSFYSIATDNLGHREAAPAVPDTQTAVQPSGITAVVRAYDTELPSDPGGEAEAIGEGIEWLDEWNRFWVEIWGSTPYADLGIGGFSVDLVYNTEYFTATSVEGGPAFADDCTGLIDDGAGRVELCGSTAQTDVGDDKYVLLARVLLEPTDSDTGVPHNASWRHLTPVYDLGIDLEDAQAALAGEGGCVVEARHPRNPELWPMTYDLDDDGCVGFGDVAFFATAYQQRVGDPGADFAWACDFDHSERVDVGDLAFFAENFQRASGDPIVYPGNFPAAWRTEDLVLRQVAGPAMKLLRAVIDPASGLLYNEATQAELDAGTGDFASAHFVPAQLGNWLTAAVLSNALRRQPDSGVTTGYCDQDLVAQLETVDTQAWEAFVLSASISLADLEAGYRRLTFQVASPDEHGVELDWLDLRPADVADELGDPDGLDTEILDELFASWGDLARL